MNLRRYILWCGIIVLAALALVFWFAGPSHQSATMPSGVVITLEGVSYGKEHRFVYGSLVQKLRSKLSERVFGKSGAVVVTHRTTNNSAVAWLVWTGKPETVLSTIYNVVVVNHRDERVVMKEWSTWTRPDNNTAVIGQELALPRQGKTLRLRFYEIQNSRSVCVGEFKIHNPVHADAPSWKPEPLPVSREDAGVTFTLAQFTAENVVQPERGFSSALNTLKFQIAEQGQRTTNWQLRAIHASDALGNRNSYGVASYSERNGDETWTGNWLLWPDEPAWKLRLEFARRGGFAADELWHVRGIAVPHSNSLAPAPFQTNLQGVSLSVRGISDARGFLSDGTMSVNATSNVLDLKWTPALPGLRVSLLEVKDDRGRKIEVRGSVGGDHDVVGYALNVSSDVQSVDARFAVRRSRFVEMLVKPELLPQTNLPKTIREK
jgi:hypothetical protein